ncbi:MAG: Pr6Pr family membrane protein [Oscillospiraceae bacterium]|nr:Pr6Pr family membrane protein [Oscillospiraceae bacterium]
MSEMHRAIISIVLKLLLVISTTIGLILCFTSSGFMGGKLLLLYFTVQSNIWIALFDLVMAIMYINAIRGGKYILNSRMYLLQLIFTVSITLTGFVYCFVLAPAFIAMDTYNFNPFSLSQVLVHIVTPLLAIIDFIGFTRGREFNKKESVLAVIPPLYYLAFSVLGYYLNWDFGGGQNYPYFFLNFDSPAGLFGLGGQAPYFMGSAYWIAIITVFVLLISLGYIKIINRRINKLPNKI